MISPSRPSKSLQVGGVERPFAQVPLTITVPPLRRASVTSIAVLRDSPAPQAAAKATSDNKSTIAARRKEGSTLATDYSLDLTVETGGETLWRSGALLQHPGSFGSTRLTRYLESQDDRFEVFEPKLLFY